MPAHRIAIVLSPAFEPLDVTGPHSVFASANTVLDHLDRDDPRYAITLVGEAAGAHVSESGLSMVADIGFLDAVGPYETIVVAGGIGALDIEPDDAVARWLAAASADRIATVCTGTFVAAAAGVCRGASVTTHWLRAERLAERYPDLRVSPDAIFVKDGSFWSSAGVTAGVDLALALVADDLGEHVAQLVARLLVVARRRSGGQSQYAPAVFSDPPTTDPIRQAIDVIHRDLTVDLSVTALANTVALSERHFVRLFRREVGTSVARYVGRVRLEAARRILETEPVGLAVVASRTGFGSAEVLRRSFQRCLGVSPSVYRRQFAEPLPT